MRLFAPFLPNGPSNLPNWKKEKMLEGGSGVEGIFGQLPKLCGLSAAVWVNVAWITQSALFSKNCPFSCRSGPGDDHNQSLRDGKHRIIP